MFSNVTKVNCTQKSAEYDTRIMGSFKIFLSFPSQQHVFQCAGQRKSDMEVSTILFGNGVCTEAGVNTTFYHP